jgi:hypothetical protein
MLFGSIHWHLYVLYSLVILYLSFLMFSLCSVIVCMGYFDGLLVMLLGGWVSGGCCGGEGFGRFVGVLGIIIWFSVMCFVLSVRGCGWLLHGAMHSWLHLGWQKSCSAMFSALFLVSWSCIICLKVFW